MRVHPEVVVRLRCPVCREPLSAPVTARGPLHCPLGHSFDQAKQGYAQLTARPLVHTGDTPEMVVARESFLTAGHFRPITEALAGVAGAGVDGLIVDIGAGTGHHLAAMLDAAPGALGLALDASKASARRAARAHDRMDAVIADAWQPLPIQDAAASVLVNVFAPRTGAEFARVLDPGGVLIVVTPQPRHLGELIEPLALLQVDPAKPDRVAAELGDWFRPDGVQRMEWTMHLSRPDVTALVGMGPSAWHADRDGRARAIAALPEPMAVTATVAVSRYLPLR
jgi:23S rRNA (guanine745-N1)-methyltransferase